MNPAEAGVFPTDSPPFISAAVRVEGPVIHLPVGIPGSDRVHAQFFVILKAAAQHFDS